MTDAPSTAGVGDAPEQRKLVVLRRAALVASIVVAGLWLGWTALAEPELPDFTAEGEPAPLPAQGSVRSVTLDEFESILVGQRGRPVVVNVWASWCAPCRTEMPLLQRAADTYAGEAVILGVNTDNDPTAAEAFLDELGLDFPNVMDATDGIGAALDVSAFPTTYLVDANGTITARVDGGISEQRLAGLIEDALG